jgi:hypothetical protein
MAMTDGFMRRGFGLARAALGSPVRPGRLPPNGSASADAAAAVVGNEAGAMEAAVRNPLRHIAGAAEMLLDTPLGPLQRTYVRAILGWSEDLRGGLDRALGRPAPTAGETVDLAALGEALRTLLAGTAAATATTLTIVGEPDVPPLFCADATALRRLAVRLLAGALARSEGGSVSMRVLRVTGGVRLAVMDSANIESADAAACTAEMLAMADRLQADLEILRFVDGLSVSLTVPNGPDSAQIVPPALGAQSLMALIEAEFEAMRGGERIIAGAA